MSLEDQYNALSLSDLDGFITAQQEEHLQLDFKVINRPDLSHRDDRKTLAKAISGFANSSGGLIVWGIVATKNADGIDCATDRQEIDPLPLFLSKLNEHTGTATSPLVDGILHRGIASTGNKGFAVTLVPESDSGPHMAKMGEDRYYKRSGDSFYKMEHFDLADMFGRRPKPKLSLNIECSGGGYNIRESELILDIMLVNEGRGSAAAPFVEVQVPQGTRLRDTSWAFRTLSGTRRKQQFTSESTVVVHPDTKMFVARYELKVPGNRFSNVVVPYRIAALDCPSIRDEAHLDGHSLPADYLSWANKNGVDISIS